MQWYFFTKLTNKNMRIIIMNGNLNTCIYSTLIQNYSEKSLNDIEMSILNILNNYLSMKDRMYLICDTKPELKNEVKKILDLNLPKVGKYLDEDRNLDLQSFKIMLKLLVNSKIERSDVDNMNIQLDRLIECLNDNYNK